MCEEYLNDNIDYKTFYHKGVLCRGPKPDKLVPGEYLCCIGASQTFGRFCEKAYPELLSEDLGVPVLNMGWGGAGIRVFFEDPKRLQIINESRGVVVQAMSGRTESTHIYKSIFGVWQEDKLTKKQQHNDAFLKKIVSDGLYLPDVMRIIRESEIQFIESHIDFLKSIRVPALFFWFGENKQSHKIKDFASFLGSFPHWVSMDSFFAMSQIFSYSAQCTLNHKNKGYYYDQKAQIQAKEALVKQAENLWLRKNPEVWIMSEARSGSTLMSNLLNNILVDSEPYFGEHVHTERKGSGDIEFSSRKRSKLIRLGWRTHHSDRILLEQPAKYPQRLYIFTKRRNIVKQVVSSIISSKIGHWHAYPGNKEIFENKNIQISDDELLEHYENFASWNQWDDFQNMLDPSRYITVWYEDFMKDKKREMKRVLEFIGHKCDYNTITKALDNINTVETSKIRSDNKILQKRLKELINKRKKINAPFKNL